MAMKCRTCQYELSQCLDGRLPTGRRTVVMQHVDVCDTCAQFWHELQQAQELVLRLPSHHVSNGFREQLFERIESGEGTPEAVFHEPVPLGAKLRYVGTGAAAAAAVLVGMSLWHGVGQRPAEHASAQIARIPDQDRVPAPDHNIGYGPSAVGDADAQPGSSEGNLFTVCQPWTTEVVSKEAALRLRDSFNSTRRWVSDIQRTSPHVNQATVVAACRSAADVQRLGALMLLLCDLRRVQFSTKVDGDLRDELRLVVHNFDNRELLERQDLNAVQTVVAPVLERIRYLSDLPQVMLVSPAFNPDDQREALLEMVQRESDALNSLFIFLKGDPDDLSDLPMREHTYCISGSCGQTFVAPRRLIGQMAGQRAMGMTEFQIQMSNGSTLRIKTVEQHLQRAPAPPDEVLHKRD
jgi:hypothetical protein